MTNVFDVIDFRSTNIFHYKIDNSRILERDTTAWIMTLTIKNNEKYVYVKRVF
jgi:hypothetical protein